MHEGGALVRGQPLPQALPEFLESGHVTAARRGELARLGDKSVAALAKDLGISESCLRNWMAQADTDENGSPTRLTSAEKKELVELAAKLLTGACG